MNAPVLALIGQIPDADIGQGLGHLHEIRDQAGIIKRLVDHCAPIRKPEQASRATALALRAMRTGRPGPAALECAIDVWGKSGAGRRAGAAAGSSAARSTPTRSAAPQSGLARRSGR